MPEIHLTRLDDHATPAYVSKDHEPRNTAAVEVKGFPFIPFEQTACDLPLTIQASSYIDRPPAN